MQNRAAPTETLTSRQFELVAKALADPRRVALLEAIGSAAEYPCHRLCEEFPVTKGTISAKASISITRCAGIPSKLTRMR
jgi:hypothetical protein